MAVHTRFAPGLLVLLCALVDSPHDPTADTLPESRTGSCCAGGTMVAGVMLCNTLEKGPSSQQRSPLDDGGTQRELPSCIQVRAEARYGALGYDHWVVVSNHCDTGADCMVATNVNPKATKLRVESGETREVLTFRGSPARTFEPRVACTLSKKAGAADE